MGCTQSTEESKVSRRLDAELIKEGRAHQQDVKMLLLGPGESGKSTLFKQMKILARPNGYSDEELFKFSSSIHRSVMQQMLLLVDQMREHGRWPQDQAMDALVDRVRDAGEQWSHDAAQAVETLWSKESVKQEAQQEDTRKQLNESAPYFFDSLNRLKEDNYKPTQQDVLRCRVRSTGIEEADFQFDELRFRMFDVGGQRSERRKWIHCFDSVTVVIFCASLSEYDQTLREDPTCNRMKESLLLFDEIVNSPWFRKTPVVLFLNKYDLFQEKIVRVPLKVCFANYSGPNSAKEAREYIGGRFLDLPQDKSKAIYMHYTVAVDTENIATIFRVVKETLLREILSNFVV